MSQARHWIFTTNNYTDHHVQSYKGLVPREAEYITFGYEVAPETGTPHLQGYIVFNRALRLRAVRTHLFGSHVEVKRGTPEQARDYSQKEGVFEEEGQLPVQQGAREDITEFKLWVSKYYTDHGAKPIEAEYSVEFPGLFVRYRNNLQALVNFICPDPVLEDGALKPWQSDIWAILHSQPDDRKIIFIIDPQGGSGKTWLQRYLLSHLPRRCQVLSSGKRDDVAHAIDDSKDVFLFNIPRGGMDYLNYTVLEQIKDKMVFSPKYNSRTKIFRTNTHVIVFCNEEPNLTKMTRDRFHCVNLNDIVDVIN